MAKSCSICGKTSISSVTLVKLRGKYNPTAKRRQYPNLQWMTLASGKRIKACTKCMKTAAKKPGLKIQILNFKCQIKPKIQTRN